MAPRDTSSQRRRTDKLLWGSESTAPTRSALSSTQNRLLAYQLGSISRSKIEREASKIAPRLNKLVGHATIFDNAARFIMEHINDDITELDQMGPVPREDELHEEELCLGDLAGLEKYTEVNVGASQVSFEVTPQASFNGYGRLNATKDCNVEVATTVLGGDGNVWDTEIESSMEATDFYGYLNRGNWIDSFCKGGECNVQPGCEVSEACSMPVATSTFTQESHDDDFLLWSQQPRVLSPKQAESLFIEAFG